MVIFSTNCDCLVKTWLNNNLITEKLKITSSGRNRQKTEYRAIKEANIASTKLANTLLKPPFNENVKTEINISLDTNTIKINNITYGKIYNVNNLYNIIGYFMPDLNKYGANVTVNYYATAFKDITYIENGFPLINLGANDYILYTITVPDECWLSNHNYFSLTPYFYSYTNNNLTTNVFASIDVTIEFFKKFNNPNNEINICLTCSKKVSKYYREKGYIISKIPVEYINSGSFTTLFRVGIINKYTFNINKYVKASYYKSDDTKTYKYYNAADIIASFPRELLPVKNKTFQQNLYQYDTIVNYLNSNNYTSIQTAKYLSNYYNTNYAFQSFFDAITVSPPAQMQANNTGENYFNSTSIDLTTLESEYFYVLVLNQKLMLVALTSNIQIYNDDNKDIIPNGSTDTSSQLPVFTYPTYPFIENDNNLYPLFQLIGL